jgi:excinuclease ABC subunit C
MERSLFSPDEVKFLPNKPGIYKFYSGESKILYVGKAKDLKKRVASYFHGNVFKGKKTQRLINETKKVEITIVNSEFDAFLLENSLIKEHQPKYNILLKDDKTFPFVCVTHERFPRVVSTRKREPGAGNYFGPYASVRAMNNVLELIRNLYHVRTCKYLLTESNIEKKKFKVCLEYHIGKCKAPCIGLQKEEDYNTEIQYVLKILNGDLKPVRDFFKDQMTVLSNKLEFEKAEEAKQRLLLLEKFQSKSVVVNPKITNVDVFTIVSDDEKGYINYLKIYNGSIHQTFNLEVKKRLEESDQEILALWIIELRNKYQSNAEIILSNIPVPGKPGAPVTVPQKGDKRNLVELSLKNALYYKKEKNTVEPRLSLHDKILIQLQEDLQLKAVPKHIECFDNSNIQGSDPVASMVCFRNGKPSKKDYRKFNIKSVKGPDDFASMHEIVYRRYSRVKDDKGSLPDLIVIDGGKGQLNAAIKALNELNLYGSIPVIGIAKRLEEIYYPYDDIPLYIEKKSSSLKLLQQIRNEAHRFAITFHRDKRSKTSLTSQLDNIKGIGPKSKTALLSHFRSFDNILKASPEDIETLLGPAKSKILLHYIKKIPPKRD